MEGWISLHRQISENDLWLAEPFSKGQAWVDLILLANHKDNSFFKRGIRIIVKRGQVAWSEKALSARWKWSRNKVRKFLELLIFEHQILVSKSNVTQIITIKKYEDYQSTRHQKDTKKTPERHQKDTNNNVNNINSNNSNELYVENKFRQPLKVDSKSPHEKTEKETSHEVKSHEVEKKKSSAPKFSKDANRIYEAYPKKCFVKETRTLTSKAKNKEKIERILKSGELTVERFLAVIEKYIDSCRPTDNHRDFIPPLKNFSTFLNNIPDYSDKELGVSMVSEIIDENFTLDCDINEGMLDGFTRKDRILCNRYLDGDFRDNTFVEVAEILDRMMGFEYRFGAEKLDSDAIEFDYS